MSNVVLLGRGPAYPHTREGGGRFPLAEGSKLVGMGIKQFFLTPKGKRMMLKRLGSSYGALVFSLKDEQRDRAILEVTRRDSKFFEPRADIIKVTVTQEEETNDLFISVDYKDIETGVSGNVVIKNPTTFTGV